MNESMVSPEIINAIMGSKYAPMAMAIVAVVAIYGIHEYFDKVEKGIAAGYDTQIASNKHGQLQFTRQEKREELS